MRRKGGWNPRDQFAIEGPAPAGQPHLSDVALKLSCWIGSPWRTGLAPCSVMPRNSRNRSQYWFHTLLALIRVSVWWSEAFQTWGTNYIATLFLWCGGSTLIWLPFSHIECLICTLKNRRISTPPFHAVLAQTWTPRTPSMKKKSKVIIIMRASWVHHVSLNDL